jgi:hypothetical protein
MILSIPTAFQPSGTMGQVVQPAPAGRRDPYERRRPEDTNTGWYKNTSRPSWPKSSLRPGRDGAMSATVRNT